MVEYEAYKDANIGKVGSIPAHWEIIRIGNLFEEISDRYETGMTEELPLLSVSEYYGIAKRSDKIADDSILVRAESLDGYKICRPGDIVSNIMLTWKGALGSSPYSGIVSPAYCVYRPRSVINSRYFHYLFRTKAYTDIFRVNSTGVIDSRLRLYTPKFFALYAPVPPKPEQDFIVEYLDKTTQRIDAIITEAKASIEEYKAWKASVIHEAVTKGLNINVGMKNTGIEWVEEIPVDIQISRVGLHFDVILGKMLCPLQIDDRYSLESYFCAANVHFSGVDSQGLKQMWFSPEEKERYLVKKGDLLVVEGGAGAGGCAVYNDNQENLYVQNSIMIVRSKGCSDNRYLKYLLESLVHRGYIDFACNKATIPHFTKEKLSSVPFPVFTLQEQSEIADYLDARCSRIDSLILEKEILISDLEAYKKSLIFEVVTGKRKVV